MSRTGPAEAIKPDVRQECSMWGMDSNATNSSYAGCAYVCGNSTLQYLGCKRHPDMGFRPTRPRVADGGRLVLDSFFNPTLAPTLLPTAHEHKDWGFLTRTLRPTRPTRPLCPTGGLLVPGQFRRSRRRLAPTAHEHEDWGLFTLPTRPTRPSEQYNNDRKAARTRTAFFNPTLAADAAGRPLTSTRTGIFRTRTLPTRPTRPTRPT